MNLELKCCTGVIVLVSALASLTSAGETSGSKCNDLGKYFAALEQNRQFSGNVLIAEKGHIIYEHSFGFADRETKRANVATTVFPTGSGLPKR
jgi:CubicO group peptidase (beta-lactamase class C family)